ncbi:MAG: dinitrogenase iron-molybdenum cofactor biosynthesis protein [Elusimicrobia bacterium]|nr:dinitrogenase iron-molybdenum cofactor biosynthesis protein [Elusimicrobiota bacterium]
MKICMSSKGMGSDAMLDPRFGRCAYFVIIDSETEKVIDEFENPAATADHGAGILAAQAVMEKEPAAVITGNVGPNASSVLHNADIKVYTFAGFEGTLLEALAKFKKESPEAADGPTVDGHFGLE